MVTVTLGPTVARSPYVEEVLDWDVATEAVAAPVLSLLAVTELFVRAAPSTELVVVICPVVTAIPYIVPELEVVNPVIASELRVALVIVGELIVGLVRVLFVRV
jgi:hypothetical protein